MKSKIEGVHFIDLEKIEDERGWLVELFREDCLEKENFPKMGYISMTKPGVVRGPHSHHMQTDIFAFIGPGDFELHLWDEIPYGKLSIGLKIDEKRCYEESHEKYVLGESKRALVVVPPGVIHAYKNISDEDGYVMNFPNQLYAGPGKKYPVDEIRHEEKEENGFSLE